MAATIIPNGLVFLLIFYMAYGHTRPSSEFKTPMARKGLDGNG